jgi:hypothetical protein
MPSKLGAPWKAVLCVDPEMNGKNGKPLKIGQNCAVVQGLEYEVRGGVVEKADIDWRVPFAPLRRLSVACRFSLTPRVFASSAPTASSTSWTR